MKSRLHETAYLNPSLTIVFEDGREGSRERIEYHEPDGIMGFVRDLNKNKEVLQMIRCISRETVTGLLWKCAFQYVNEFHENVLGFCNNIYNAEGGTHISPVLRRPLPGS